jgi:hypothetical protein
MPRHCGHCRSSDHTKDACVHNATARLANIARLCRDPVASPTPERTEAINMIQEATALLGRTLMAAPAAEGPERRALIRGVQRDTTELITRLQAVLTSDRLIRAREQNRQIRESEINENDQNKKYWEFAIAPSPDYEKVECECPVCYESCDAYKFNCSHSLCFGCYYKMKLTAHCLPRPRTTINCPMCRAEV